jgi:putative PIN family toxin of toxin-antitoxin system
VRIVPDTSVIVSAFLFPSTRPAEALRFAEQRTTLLASEETLTELYEVLAREKFVRWLSLSARERLLLRFTNLIELVPVKDIIRACRDARDDKFLSLAVSGHADLILTGDADLLCLHPFRGIAIVAPADFLSR